MKVLVTGGAGYIGSHTCVSLLEAGHEVTVIDNLCNSYRSSLDRVQDLTGRRLRFVEGDIRNPRDLARAIEKDTAAVIHFAALKSVQDSCRDPLPYFENNVGGTIALIRAMEKAGVARLVFSSSATVYGQPDQSPVTEESLIRAANPYANTKVAMEKMIRDWVDSRPDSGAVVLRYFNPAGAHPSGRIGEDPKGEPANLFPYVAQVAAGRRPYVRVFGCDYPTPDGTGVRDYLHVMDLADAHVRALERLYMRDGYEVFNLGSGRGYSVLEVVRAFENACGRRVPLKFEGRRPGDIGSITADATRAEDILGWKAKRGVDAMCADGWKWQRDNPSGYGEAS